MHHCFYCLMILHHSRVRINLSDLNGGFDTDPCSFQHSLDPDWVWHWLAWYRLPPQSHDKPMSNNWQKDLHRWTAFFSLWKSFSSRLGSVIWNLRPAKTQFWTTNEDWHLGNSYPQLILKLLPMGPAKILVHSMKTDTPFTQFLESFWGIFDFVKAIKGTVVFVGAAILAILVVQLAPHIYSLRHIRYWNHIFRKPHGRRSGICCSVAEHWLLGQSDHVLDVAQTTLWCLYFPLLFLLLELLYGNLILRDVGTASAKEKIFGERSETIGCQVHYRGTFPLYQSLCHSV